MEKASSPSSHVPYIQPPAVMLMGGPGTGKTYAISTLLEAGLEVFVLVTEPTGIDSLLDVVEKKKLDISKLHYHAVTPVRPTLIGLQNVAKQVSVLDFEGLAKLKPSGDRRTAQWITMLSTLNDFVCDRTGDSFGPVTDFQPSRALVIDSLSGINLMAMDLVTGDKPSAHQGEWGVAMSLIEKLLLTLSSSLHCIFVLNTHLERETNEITGGTTITTATLGRKLAPKLPRFFSEVVMSWKEQSSFYWSTTATGVDLKNRSLALGNKLPPTFQPIVDAYRRRLASIQPKEDKKGQS